MTAVATDRDRNGPRATEPPALGDADLLGGLRRIELAHLVESPWNPRKRFDAEQLEDLADSLRKGQLAPIIVRPIAGKHERYEIGAGHRRYRAAPMAGLMSLLAIVRDLDDVAFLELLTIENKQREDIAPLDEANGFRLLMEKAGYDVAKLAARIGLSTKYVYDRLKLLQLIPAAKKLLEDGVITAGHAILLARLSPTDQARALGDPKDVEGGVLDGDSLLLDRDHAAEDELPLHDRVKPVSVREFQKAIQRNIRARPEAVDPFLFPESAAALEAAKEEKLSVIHITRDYLASDEVRSAEQKERVFGSEAWKRADGQVDPYEDYRGAKSKTRSKPCEWSRYGFVASGPGQGEVFRVCINKQKCKIHWPEHVKRAEAAKKRAAKGSGATGTTGAAQADRYAQEDARHRAEEEREEADRARWKKALPELAKALAKAVKTAPITATSPLVARILEKTAPYPHDVWKPARDLVHVGKTAEQILRRVAWLTFLEDLNGWRVRGMTDDLKALGIDARKIVDEVAPKPKAEKKPATKKGKKGARS